MNLQRWNYKLLKRSLTIVVITITLKYSCVVSIKNRYSALVNSYFTKKISYYPIENQS